MESSNPTSSLSQRDVLQYSSVRSTVITQAAELVGEIAGRAANAAPGVEHLVAMLDRSKFGELAGRNPAHGVKILERCQVPSLQVVEVEAGSQEGFRNALSGEAGCVLLSEGHRWLPVRAKSARRSATTWG